VDLEMVVSEALRFLEADIQNSRAEIDVQTPLPTINANRTLAFQIISNLLANALKFSLPGQTPKIAIFARHLDFDCEIHVRDQGRGIPPHVLGTIFDIFQRGTAGPSMAGTGIGLAIVKKAAERARGHVTVISKEGEGSDFVVTLPCDSVVEQTAAS
jgi:signal transduction histidine kinase